MTNEKQVKREKNKIAVKTKKSEVVISMPRGVTASMHEGNMTIKGPKGEIIKKILDPKIRLVVNNGIITINPTNSDKFTQMNKKVMGTFKAHINNMVRGVQGGYVYELKVCSGHFPMNVSYGNGVLSVKNFLGEKVPRTLKTKPGVKVKVEGDKITLEGCDKEAVGQTSADIEQLTRITDKDRRIFQDGIYITKKGVKEVK